MPLRQNLADCLEPSAVQHGRGRSAAWKRAQCSMEEGAVPYLQEEECHDDGQRCDGILRGLQLH